MFRIDPVGPRRIPVLWIPTRNRSVPVGKTARRDLFVSVTEEPSNAVETAENNSLRLEELLAELG